MIHLPLATYYAAFSFYRRISSHLTEGVLQWDDVAVVWPSALEALTKWVSAVLDNPKRDLRSMSDIDAHVLVTDASAWGWGAIYTNGSAVHCESKQWSWRDRLDGRHLKSTWAETEAVYRALCRFVRPREKTKVILLTDGIVTALAVNRGHAESFDVNQGVSRIQNSFGKDLEIHAIHIAGESNPADRPSRGGDGFDMEQLRGTLGALNLLGNSPSNKT